MTSPWPQPDGYLAEKQPVDVSTRSFTVVRPPSIVTLITVAAAPSGSGELALSDLTVDRNVATVKVSGGVAGRVYSLKAIATGTDSHITESIWFLPMAVTLMTDPPTLAPSAGYGVAVEWPYETSLDFSKPLNSGYLVLLGGF